MDNPHTPAPLRQDDYEAIEAAVMETEKGRWFLAEYARRHRAADTETVLQAISGLERLLQRERRPDVDRIRLDVGEMKDAIDRTKSEIAQLKQDGNDGSRFERATNELDSIVTQTETATSEILGAAEKLQEVAFTMREGGIEGEICDAIETLVMTIYTACSFQDLTGQRTQKVVRVLHYLESRINSMIEIWGMDGGEVAVAAASAQPVADARPDAHLLNGPAQLGHGIDQSSVDDLMGDVVAVEPYEVEELLVFDRIMPAEVAREAAQDVPPDNDADIFDSLEVDIDGAVDGAFDEASIAMETAIGALREVRDTVSVRPPAKEPAAADIMDELSRVERQALFSG
jgi:hypothetical protein